MAYKIKGEVTVEQGLGLPRLTTAQRLAYTPPASGFTVYDTDTSTLFVWDGTAWVAAGGAAPVDSVNGQIGVVVLTDADLAVTPSGNLAATNVEDALLELQADIDLLSALGASDYISGENAPGPADGVDGNYYLDVLTGDVYGPKAGGVWPGTPINNVFDVNLSSAVPLPDAGAGSAGTGTPVAREDHVHPEGALTNHSDVDLVTNAPVSGQYLVFDGTNWVPGVVDAATYEAAFAGGDWTVGTPNTYTVTAATHGLTVKPVYDVTVVDSTGCVVGIETLITPTGDVQLRTAGTTFAGTIKISC